MNPQSSWLYKDKTFKNKLTKKQIEKWWKKRTPFYFYDGNNGDKHLLVGKLENGVLAINLSQSHIFSDYESHQNVNDIIAKLNDQDITPNFFINLMHEIMVMNW